MKIEGAYTREELEEMYKDYPENKEINVYMVWPRNSGITRYKAYMRDGQIHLGISRMVKLTMGLVFTNYFHAYAYNSKDVDSKVKLRDEINGLAKAI